MTFLLYGMTSSGGGSQCADPNSLEEEEACEPASKIFLFGLVGQNQKYEEYFW